MTRAAEDQCRTHRLGESPSLKQKCQQARTLSYTDTQSYLVGNFLLLLPRQVHKVIVLCAYEDRNGRLVESSPLTIPLLDAVQRALAGQVEHKQDGHGIVAHERQHIDELALAAKIPDAEGNLGVADADGLFHEVDAQSLDVVLVPAAFDIFDHQTCLANLSVANHADLDDNVIAPIGLLA